MIRNISAAGFLLLLVLSAYSTANESPFKQLAEPPKAADEEFFQVINGEAKVEGHVITLFVAKPKHLTVSYKNSSVKELFPEYVVRTFNRYGILLGSSKVGVSLFGGSDKLDVGDVGGEKITLDLVDIASVFKHSNLNLPADFYEIGWISLAESNTRLALPSVPKE